MKLSFTESAKEKLNKYVANKETFIKLKYETEGCGCVVSGVPFLWIVAQKEEDDMIIDTDYKPVLMEKSKTVFFDEDMKIDFIEVSNCFRLSSPNQILNPRMLLIEKSETAHESKA